MSFFILHFYISSEKWPNYFQYLPHLSAVHLFAIQSLDCEEKRSYKFLEAFFLAIYNTEAVETQTSAQQQSRYKNFLS
jgi:hypothetical protein